MTSRTWLAASAGMIALAIATPAIAQVRNFDISAETLSTAITKFGRQAGLQIIAPDHVTRSRRSNPVRGQMETRVALGQLIAGSGLVVAADHGGTIVLREDKPVVPPTKTSDTDQVEHSVESGEIVVTGFRASEQASIKAKRQSPVILDSISQDDAGRLPDLNIVEASRRIVGISVVGGSDVNRNRDIYQRATIRGLDPRYNLVTIDGIPLASSDYSYRGARLDMLPSSLVSRIEAIKTVSAQYDPHALGGQVNIVPKSAFEQSKRRLFVVNASGGLNDSTGKLVSRDRLSYRADATGSFLFGDQDQFGIVASAEYQRLTSSVRAEMPDIGYVTQAGVRTPFVEKSTGVPVVVRGQDYAYENVRTRASGNLKLEWRPSDRTEFSVFGGYYHERDVETRFDAANSGVGAPVNTTATSGTFLSGNTQRQQTFQPADRSTWLISAKGHAELRDGLLLDATVARSEASYSERRQMSTFDSVRTSGSGNPRAAYSYTLADGGFPKLTMTDRTFVSDPANYVNRRFRRADRDINSVVDFGKINIGYNAAAADRGLGFDVGGTITRTTLAYDQTFREWGPRNAAAGQAFGTLSGLLLPNPPELKEAPGLAYMLIDYRAAFAKLDANPNLFRRIDTGANNFGDDFRDLEVTKAAYARLLFNSDRFNFQAALRYDRTDLTIDTFQPADASAVQYVPLRRNTNYAYFLPSALATYNFTDEMRLRAGISKTIGRPDYNQYAARTSFGVSPGEILTINTGNPNLKPRESWNYDLSYEWYLGRAGMFTVAGFVKSIRNEIFTSVSRGPATEFGGIVYNNVTISSPQNAAKAQVKGLEVAYSQDNLFLRGLGLNANLTLLDGYFVQPNSELAIAAGYDATRRTSGLIQQPDYIANVTLFYATGPFEIRGSYNRIGRALQSADADTSARDTFQEPRQQIDAQARYRVSNGIELVAQVQNLTGEPFSVKHGPSRQLIENYFPVGRTFWIGFSWRPGQ